MSNKTELVRVQPGDQRVRDARARLLIAQQHTHDTLVALRAEVVHKTDWREVVRARPLQLLSIAFVLGFFIGRRR